MSLRLKSACAVGAMILACTVSAASATITTFDGVDNAAAGQTTMPTTDPNSAAAGANFTTAASAFGTVYTDNFGSYAYGSANGPGGGATWATGPARGGESATITTPWGTIYVNNPSSAAYPDVSINNNGSYNAASTTGACYATCGYAQPGATKFLELTNATVTFTFTSPTHSFGVYLTGVQSSLNSSALSSNLNVSFTDANGAQTENIASIGETGANGGTTFFGFTDTAGFTSITLTDPNPGTSDVFGISQLQFNSTASAPVTTAPEPRSWALMMVGIGMGGAALRRNRGRRSLRAA